MGIIDVFKTEGNIASAIDKFMTKVAYPMPVDEHNRYIYSDFFARKLYEDMDAENWLRSTVTEDDVFANICTQDPYKMFQIGLQIAILRKNIEEGLT